MSDENYWNFKILLADGQDRSDSLQNKTWNQANMSMPFLTDGVASNAEHKRGFYPSVEEDNLFEGQQRKAIKFETELSLDNLDDLSISQLQRLRRAIALELHPDRGQARCSTEADFEMSDANRCIDDAIKKKSGFGV